MGTPDTRPVLYLIVCGAGPARQLPGFVRFSQDLGWDVCVITTPAGATFLDAGPVAELTGYPVRVSYKHPDEPDVLPPAGAFVIAPATFNTINKLAAGISDTLALGLLNEAIGASQPIIAVPFPNQMLARHPVFTASINTLRSWGLRVVFNPELHPLPSPRQAEPGNTLFPWTALRHEFDK